MKRLTALMLLLMCLLPQGQAEAYVTNSSGGKLLRWDDSSFPLKWYINLTGYTQLSEADILQAFTHGMDQWTKPTCSKFRHSYQGKTTKGNASDRTNTLMFGPLNGFPSSTTAVTTTRWGATDKRYTDADIIFRSTKPWSLNPTQSQLDLRGTATHEIGHMLGLAHTGVNTATMYAKTETGPTNRRFLGNDDIQGICFLYPSGNPPPTQDARDGRGDLCGSSANGATCKDDLICVSKANNPAYCLEPCEGNDQCPQGGSCFRTTSGSRFCACDADSDCPNTKTCFHRNCFTKEGGTCKVDAECLAPLTCQAGACTKAPAPCTQDQDCPNDTVCLEGKCISKTGGCTSDQECPSTQICDSGQCVAKTAKGVGESCQRDADCLTQLCLPISTDGNTYCTKPCQQDSDCPPANRCFTAQDASKVCVVKEVECFEDKDCQGSTCTKGQCQSPTERGTPTEPTRPSESTPDTTSTPDQGPNAPPEATGPTDQPTTPPTPTGCGCQQGEAPLSFVFLCAFLLFLVLSITKKPHTKRPSTR